MKIVLLIEDSVELTKLVERELQASGFQVLSAQDGESGLELFKRHLPDLVLLDWMLPGINGLETLRRLRNISTAPVLMLTARSDLSDRVLGLETGADDYLVKPFELAELVARVRAQFRRVDHYQSIIQADRAPAHGALCWRGICLDPEAFQAEMDGEPLALTRIEFDLLQLLVRNPGRTFNRRYLLETVWDAAYLDGDRAVDNTILRLRKKLGAYVDDLETVRGVGYRLKHP